MVYCPAVRTTSFTTWVASQTYGQMKACLTELSAGLGVSIPGKQQKSSLERMVRRWVVEADKPTSDRKRNRAEAAAGQRIRILLAQRHVTL